MTKKRTKTQKRRAAEKRSTEFIFSAEGVVVTEAGGENANSATKQKKATTPMDQKGVKSSFGSEITKLLYQDLRKTGIVTAVVFCILFGIYTYVR